MSTEESSAENNVPVLIVGGGMAGVSAALMLQYHGVDFVLVDKGNGLSARPRARVVYKRTVEILRQLGIEDRMAEAAQAFVARKQGALGIRIGPTIMASEVMEVAPRGYRGDELSPTNFLFAPQSEAEQILLDVARERGGDLRFDTDLSAFEQDADGVRATLTGPAGTTTLRAAYLIVVDDENQPVRAAFGTAGWQLPPSQHYVNVHFRADLTEHIAGRTFSQCRLVGGTVQGMMASTNFTDEWELNAEYDPAQESFADYPVERCVEVVRSAVGAGDIDVRVTSHEAWDTGSWVADTYRHGRVFLAGDAAHRQPPWGGYAPNLGLGEVHNLAWKLAAVLAGRAGDGLLDTYHTERRERAMIAAQQSMVMNDFHARFGVETPENAASLATLIGMEPTMTRFRYGAPPGKMHVETLSGQTGTRVPHVWLTEGDRRFSTMDVCGRGFTVQADTELAEWRRAVADVATETGLEISLHHVDPAKTDTPDAWRREAELPDGGALLIRPDQHVLARSDEELSPATLLDVVKRAVA